MEPYELDEKGRIVGTTLTPEDLASVIEQIKEGTMTVGDIKWLRKELKIAQTDAAYYYGEYERLRALLSWIEGACVDELPHSEIRAAIERLSDEGGDDG